MVSDYLKTARYRIFPQVKDWTADNNDLRSMKVKDMRWIEWFWFHPSAFKLMKLGIPIIGMIHFSVASVLCFWFAEWIIIGIIMSFMSLWCLWTLIKSNKELKIARDMNFYDLYLRDYEVKL